MRSAFLAAYQAALLEPDWPARAVALTAAWEMRPHRLEPLHALVQQLNQHDMHQAAYALASVARTPCQDILFVHRFVWDWGPSSLSCRSRPWWVGEMTNATPSATSS